MTSAAVSWTADQCRQISAAWLRDDRVTQHAATSAERRCTADDARQRGIGGEAAGLVSYKTSGNDSEFQIPTSPHAVRERRIKSLRRNVWASGKLISNSVPSGYRCWFVTLTYRGVADWTPRHISEAIRAFRHWCKKRSLKPRYVWVAELQQRGAMHYHLAVWLPAGISCPMWDKGGRNYAPFWPHGMTNRQLARNAVAYLMKYMSKVGTYHEYPKHARIHGAGGLEPDDRQTKSFLNYPTWLKQIAAVGETCIRAGRRVVRETGEILESPFQLVRRHRALYLRAVREIPETWVSGPWSRYTPEVTA